MDLDELVFHPWSAQGPRSVPTFVGGSGSHVVDADGRRSLDFSSQLVFATPVTSKQLMLGDPRFAASERAAPRRLLSGGVRVTQLD